MIWFRHNDSPVQGWECLTFAGPQGEGVLTARCELDSVHPLLWHVLAPVLTRSRLLAVELAQGMAERAGEDPWPLLHGLVREQYITEATDILTGITRHAIGRHHTAATEREGAASA